MPLPTGFFALPYTSPVFWFLPMMFLVLCELVADFLGKEWTLRKKSVLFAASLSMYVIGNVFWLFSVLNGVGLGRGSMIFAVGQELSSVTMGVIYFKEILSKRQWIGMLLGFFTIVLMGAYL